MSYRIKRFQLANYKAIRVVDITPDGDVVLASTENGEGKSSAMDGLEWTLRGKEAAPDEPVRRGAKKARGVALIADETGKPVLVVEREQTVGGNHRVVVREPDSDVSMPAPQSVLETLYSTIACEPMVLERMLFKESKKFAEILRGLSGLSTDDIDQQVEKLTRDRLFVGRDRDQAKARCDVAAKRLDTLNEQPLPHPLAPQTEVDVAELAAELEKIRAQAYNNRNARERQIALQSEKDLAQRERDAARARVDDLEIQLSKAKQDVIRCGRALDDAQAEHEEQATLVQGLVDPDESGIRTQIANAAKVNAEVRANAQAQAARSQAAADSVALIDEYEQHRAKYERLSETIATLAEQKRARIASAKFPIEGLGFEDDGTVTYQTRNGVLPLKQASEGERYKVYAAMGVAQNPKLRVLLMRDSKDLGPKNRAMLAELAHANGWDCWWETLDTSTPGALVFEAGSIVKVNPKE